MFWPRFKLTPEEEKAGAVKYYDPDTGKRGVLRRMYTGQLVTSQIQRAPVLSFRVPRRVRIFGLTASGDVPQFKVRTQTTTGEQHIVEATNLATLLGGYVAVPPPVYSAAVFGGTGGFPKVALAGPVAYGNMLGSPASFVPHIFEPNIVLLPNQTLAIYGTPMTDYQGVDFRVDVTLHVWEFPVWPVEDPSKKPTMASKVG